MYNIRLKVYFDYDHISYQGTLLAKGLIKKEIHKALKPAGVVNRSTKEKLKIPLSAL